MKLTADWDAIADAVKAGTAKVVTATVDCLTTVPVDDRGDPIDPRVLLRMHIVVPAGADWRHGEAFPVTLPSTPFDLHVARREVLVELAKRGLVDPVAQADKGLDTATGDAPVAYSFRTFGMPDGLNREQAVERINLIGGRRPVSMQTFSSYVSKGKITPRWKDGAHPMFSAADIDVWVRDTPQRGAGS